MKTPEFVGYFLGLSAELTGFSRFDLEGTGQADLYFDTVLNTIGEQIFKELLETFHQLDKSAKKKHNPTILSEGLREEILSSATLGPVARNIIKLWYTATWDKLPKSLESWYGINQQNSPFIPSPQSYAEGLVWKAVGVNPPGAKAPGYGTWSEPPSVSLS
ncbi:hypothetical protein [Sphaerospermopsis torques-reginae]|uniref:Membrane bound FAD containing D-sorbitol dehydrogenase n=1 Tax=Sphaerospermopsis torques-reginae ITEP-024 TaxID=984208 RepID=A0ABX8WY39_9CYAN|nr:hypothetical protein [Sphaerospermopsis torques-reginae]QYX31282.1 hypothetical protein K2F26_21050 [Sphaerospermopsis torques-reginae ITEP-024]